jgi:predicted metal-binding membrane protein
VTATIVGLRPPRREAARRWWWRHPELPVLATAGIAWAVMIGDHFAHHATAADAPWGFDPRRWTLMIVAMMVPGAIPMARRVAFDSLWRRRNRNVAIFAAAYTSAWVLVGVAGASTVAVAESVSGTRFDPAPPLVASALLFAAAWQFTPQRRRALRRCHLRPPIAPLGWRATRDLVRYGLVNAWSCMGACAGVMAAMFVAGHDLHLMVPLTVVTMIDRFQRQPRPAAGACALAVTALLATVT